MKTIENYTNFITPPDSVNEEKYTVLLVDVAAFDVEQLAIWCKTASQDFNVYLYSHTMDDVEWLSHAFAAADSVIINTELTPLTPIKDRLVSNDKVWYYGPKNFITNRKVIRYPAEFFIQLTKQTT
jgi:hypothetical protein